MDWLTSTLVAKFILGSIIAICVIVLAMRMLGASGHSLSRRTPQPAGAPAPAGTAQPVRVTERTVVRTESSRSSGSVGMILFGLLIVGFLVWFFSLGGREWIAANNRPAIATVNTGSEPIPARGRGHSESVNIPPGRFICQYAELGPSSFEAEYRDLTGGEWTPLPGGVGGFASAIRWASTSRAQTMYYSFVRVGGVCPATWSK